jgi:hypothetical protein
MSTAGMCANCEAELVGKFCAVCGQKRTSPHDYSLWHFLEQSLHEIVHFDTKVFGSLIPLIFKPGFLTAEYLAGRRQRYIKPMTLFVVVNVAFFFLGHWRPFFDWDLGIYMNGMRGVTEPMIERKIAEEGTTREKYEEHYHEVAREAQREMFVFAIPLLALGLVPLFRKRYYVEHLIYSIHFHAFFLAYLYTGVPLLILSALYIPLFRDSGVARAITRDPGILAPILLGMVVYHLVAVRRVYKSGALRATITALALPIVEFLILFFVYRPIMFFVVYYLT